MAALTAEQAYKAAHEDFELAQQRAAYAAWGAGRDCTEADYQALVREELLTLWNQRIERGGLPPLEGKAA